MRDPGCSGKQDAILGWAPHALARFVAGMCFVLPAVAGFSAESKTVSFERDIAPVLRQACGKCHSRDTVMARLRLDSEAGILKGGVSGPAIVPGDSGGSLLVKRLLGTDGAPRMPIGAGPLPSARISLIRAWIDQNDFKAAKASLTLAAGQPAPQQAQSAPAQESPLFASRVKPIFATRCYGCHGPDVQQNGLRLDSLEGALKGSETGKVITPGQSERSRLVRRLEAQERPQMPYGGPPLSKEEIGLIRQWIDAGAPGPDATAPVVAAKAPRHWAYLKPVRPESPTVNNAQWCRNPIDRFVLSRLEKEGLTPSPEADKTTLLRRVYLDLIGLPPAPQEVDAFLSDQSPDAYDKVVDHLLASPHYGERWARPWLDLARYADTNGYEKDARRTAWAYRDWVIRALNQDMSFKEFTIDQIAGDMLPHPTQDQLIATGFHRNTMLNREGGVDPEEFYWYELVDRANTTASVWLGSTLGCAQCHNHKFDPFPQKDYYRFVAFFSNSHYEIAGGSDEHYAKEAELELPTSEQAATSKALRADLAKLKVILDTDTPQLAQAQQAWETEMRSAAKNWTPLIPDKFESAGGAELKLLPDRSLLAQGKNPQADTYTLEARTDRQSITAVRIEVLPDESLPQRGPGRDPEGNFFLSEFEVEAAPTSVPQSKQPVVFKDAEADESQEGYGVKGLLHKDPGLRGWAIDATHSGVPLRRQAVLIPDKPFGLEGGTILTIRLKHRMRRSSRNLGRFRLSVTSISDPKTIVALPARLWPVLETEASRRTTGQKAELAAAYRMVAPLLDPPRKEAAALEKALEKLDIPTAMIMEEQPGYTRPAAYLRERGSFLSKGELVHADVPGAFNPLPKSAMPNRLGLAQWLVSEDNPLTARVTVNRFWDALFGHGIVETSEDFGTQGELPTHPELLDWLATEFMSNGWSMKKIQRTIVTSATYRQSSRVTPELIARDPYNKLYARGPRFRVEAEMVHDIALSASGLLSRKMYGPSVFPYQPEGIWDVPYSDDKWVQSPGEDSHRRALYTFARRSAPYPSLVTFDAPSREFCTVRRVRTNTPLQALTTLNDPYFFDAARAMARRIEKEGGDSESERAAYGFRLCSARADSVSGLLRAVSEQGGQVSALVHGNGGDPGRVDGQADRPLGEEDPHRQHADFSMGSDRRAAPRLLEFLLFGTMVRH